MNLTTKINYVHLPRLNFSRTALLLAPVMMSLVVTACSKSDDNKTGPADATKSAPPLTVAVQKIAPRQVPILIEVVGRTEGSREVEIRSRVTGIVQKQLYTEGEPVRAKKTLFQIERAPFENALSQARAALTQDRAKLEQSQRENTRLQGLLAKRAISQREADDTGTGLKQSEGAVQASEARARDAELNLSYTAVAAPISGITGRAQRSEGSLVNAGTDSSLLTTVTQTDPIWIRFSLSESEHSLLRDSTDKSASAGKPASVKLLKADDSAYELKGKLNFAGSTVDPKLGTIQLRAEFANPDLTLLPGQFVRTQLNAGNQEAIVVPQHAVFQNDQGRFVWVVDAESKATQRKVEAGSWVGHDWIIKSGLKTGDSVIVDNLIKLRPGMTVKAQEASAGAAPATAPATTAAPANSDKK
jgi:membrane fusion protein, multidrug efflux system